MDKFATLEPTKLYNGNTTPPLTHPPVRSSNTRQSNARLSAGRFGRDNLGQSQLVLAPTKPVSPLIGRLPADLHVLILTYLSIPDIGRYARASRTSSRIARDERVWERRWVDLGVERFQLGSILDDLESKAKSKSNLLTHIPHIQGPATIAVSSLDDDDEFGDFATGTGTAVPPTFPRELVDLTSLVPLNGADAYEPGRPTPTYRSKYIRAHSLLLPLVPTPNASPHTILASSTSSSLSTQSRTLHLLARFLSSAIKPIFTWDLRLASIKASLDRFDAGLLTAFDAADTEGQEDRMKEVAEASWEVWICLNGIAGRGGGIRGEWELGRVWAEKREVFYEQGKWDPLANFTKDQRLDFTPMDAFMSRVLSSLVEDGSRAVRVFPTATGVLLAFADRIASEVIAEYISQLLSHAQTLSTSLFLSATAACFGEAWRFVEGIVKVSGLRPRRDEDTEGKTEGEVGVIMQTQAEDVIYRMFQPNMDDYLYDELEELKRTFEEICKEWESGSTSTTSNTRAQGQTHFLTSQNPALVKRTVLASFTDVLLLPVTIVPRAVGAGVGVVGDAVGAIGTGVGAVGTGVVHGIAMLNPQRWAGNAGGVGSEDRRVGETTAVGYESFGKDGALFEVGEDEGEDEETADAQKGDAVEVGSGDAGDAGWGGSRAQNGDAVLGTSTPSSASTGKTTVHPSASGPPQSSTAAISRPTTGALDLLLSLDVSLQLIHAARDAIKRLETFAFYPGTTGTRVRETLEEAFCDMLDVMGSRHIGWGFKIATERMTSYKPAEHEETTSVAPLLQFFELVHIGDTIQSMVQVFFDKEMAPHIDRTDFLNVVVREKKRFENTLDDCVAGGLNAGTQVLMNQVEHIILTLTKPREYYPPEDAPLELFPTQGCKEAIRCLEMHCKLLKGSTSREVLEVFYQEVGIRLLAILQKHIKRQIISLRGGFQVIADINEYHAFITSLKVPSITSDFENLKMLGNVFIIADAKDLAQVVRDVTRYGGAYRPEDVYEFIQRRSDWKKIEKTVDKTMYNLSFKEDCVLC
ncbi:exocyst complex component Sec10-domain-containing protein [Phlebopus sp. FC_14]|nr:exocyst complex component Sec10-domain-containing protein [Phlebopus sp. FC_14]